MVPVMMPGMSMGTVTVKNTLVGVAPSSAAASSQRCPRAATAVSIDMTMKGRETKIWATTTAAVVYASPSPASVSRRPR